MKFGIVCCLNIILWSCSPVVAQDTIMTRDSTVIKCKVESLEKDRLTYVRPDNGQQIKIPALELKWVQKGGVTYFIFPAEDNNQEIELSVNELSAAINQKEYGVLLHSTTLLEDALFATGRNEVTAFSKKRLLLLFKFMADQKMLSFEIIVHTDSSGSPQANLSLSQRRATYLKNLLISQGCDAGRIQTVGKGMEEPIYADKKLQHKNRRVELRIPEIKDVQMFYAEEYSPPQTEEVKATEIKREEASPSASTGIYVPVKNKKVGRQHSFSMYAHGRYVINEASGNWSAKEGLGILQGFGGGISYVYFLKQWLGLALEVDYSRWNVIKRYTSEEGESGYTTASELNRYASLLGMKTYLGKTVYLMPQGGVAQLQLHSRNSENHPGGNLESSEKAFLPLYGGAIGWEKKLFSNMRLDIAVQYHITENKDFNEINSNMHYGGIKMGLGF